MKANIVQIRIMIIIACLFFVFSEVSMSCKPSPNVGSELVVKN